VRGAIGYVFPQAVLPPIFGANARIELGGSFVRADGSQSLAGSLGNFSEGIQFLGGRIGPDAFACQTAFVPVSCSANLTLDTDYRTWQIEGKFAGDHRAAGPVTLTPWLGLFGGEGRNNQTLVQNFEQIAVGVGTATLRYTAGTALRWTDVGAKLGLDSRVDLTNWLAFGVGGSVAVAHRDVSLSGNDICTDSVSAQVCGPANSSAISTGANATPFLLNAEASVIVRPLPNLLARGFAGINYDTDVPGISSPSFAGGFSVTASTTAASIKFADQTSWYAGGGLVWTFGPAIR
jgi:hypothetical protein